MTRDDRVTMMDSETRTRLFGAVAAVFFLASSLGFLIVGHREQVEAMVVVGALIVAAALMFCAIVYAMFVYPDPLPPSPPPPPPPVVSIGVSTGRVLERGGADDDDDDDDDDSDDTTV